MKTQSLVITILVIIAIIIAGVILFNSNQEPIETQEEEWNESGPFSIDKKQYNLGDKIFVNVENLSEDDVGYITFFRPGNSTHLEKYIDLPFDGRKGDGYNQYLSPDLYEFKKMCSIDDIVGKWKVVFFNPEGERMYPNIEFEIINQTNSWDNRTWEPVC